MNEPRKEVAGRCPHLTQLLSRIFFFKRWRRFVAEMNGERWPRPWGGRCGTWQFEAPPEIPFTRHYVGSMRYKWRELLRRQKQFNGLSCRVH